MRRTRAPLPGWALPLLALCMGPGAAMAAGPDLDGDGFTLPQDCAPNNPAIYPGAPETANALDDDCDGTIDEGTIAYDDDGDGFSENQGDCNDADPKVSPRAAEVCGDGVDNDCKGGDLSCGDIDADGDGFTPNQGDCDDASAEVFPGAEEICGDGRDNDCDGVEADCGDRDEDGDGFTGNQGDCDDTDATVNPRAQERCDDGVDQDCSGADLSCNDVDDDGDGVTENQGDCDDGNPTVYAGAIEVCDDAIDNDCVGGDLSCNDVDDDGDGFTENQGDCNDLDVGIGPLAQEVCDGVDQDCDGQVDDDPADASAYYVDADRDGYGDDTAVVISCEVPPDVAGQGGDCDDSDASINPQAEEVCDGLDNNCDGLIDPELLVASYADADGDSWGDPTQVMMACSVPDGYSTEPFDCDDTNPEVSPDGVEVCDGLDQNCDGEVDEGTTVPVFIDVDGDGYGSPDEVLAACEAPPGYSLVEGDCDDLDPTVNPSSEEVCEDGVDQDCNGLDNSCGDRDQDGDGVAPVEGDCDDNDATVYPGATEIPYDGIDQDCSGADLDDLDADGYSPEAGDCDDANPEVNPGLTEICYDGLDNDCDGTVDVLGPSGEEGDVFDCQIVDMDGDGFGVEDGDCDDSDPTANPAAPEICFDGRDNDCDGVIDENDEGDPDGDSCQSADRDGDGFTAEQGDCDDSNATVYPGATEVCDGLDNDCDGNVDRSDDADNDALDCEQVDNDGDGYTTADGDCDDNDPTVSPSSEEICGDGLDNNCDGLIDDFNAFGEACAPVDNDGDGYPTSEDCDDSNPAVNPGGFEVCGDGLDNNCDGAIDDVDASTGVACESIDRDQDGYPADVDCDDSDPGVNPGAAEVCGDGLDNNCDGTIDGTDVDGVCDECDEGQQEIPGNGIDDDCDGEIDEEDEEPSATPTPAPETEVPATPVVPTPPIDYTDDCGCRSAQGQAGGHATATLLAALLVTLVRRRR